MPRVAAWMALRSGNPAPLREVDKACAERDLTVAIHAAETALEELLMLPSDHSDMAAGAGVQSGPQFDLNMRRGGTDFQTDYEVVNGPYIGTRTVIVTVRWTDGFGRPRTLALRTHRR